MRKERRILIGATCAVIFAGCTSSSAPKVKGHWNPVNRFAESAEAIPLRPRHEFYALPVDGTLKNLLERWANDSGRTLSYRHGEDFTLHTPVARIRTTDISEAVSELSAAYAGQGVQIEIEPGRIVVLDARRIAAGGEDPEQQGRHEP
ncbi:toxin co-regulated pilus biosynthesis Q family protein [Luteimonas sp. SX5]|uniref:Toxin co-regulated pilus biosynthesis Q family protein n=1 Tax=Luteimonas galliterrae TaxID=2940486 RepID=A0ABT0MJS8_9GAMM|nr:toxin co-regulated pilus biosynthesis Q family protein [Luteimonas galliterrae]MCL1635124.1 toxin co-regulated pilus biosynthesis Q family protein [Luteimonas galliterrae]